LNKKLYKLEGVDDTGLLESHITETGLYWRHRLQCWEVWYIHEDGRKEVIGTCAKSLGEEAAQDMCIEFVFMTAYEISGVSDIVEKGEIN